MALHWMWRPRSNWNTDILCLKESQPERHRLALFSSLATEVRRPHLFFPAPKPEGDQLANEQSQAYRLRFAGALPRPADPLKHG